MSKHGKITVHSISDPTGTHAPSAGANGELGQLALLSDVVALATEIDNISGAASSFTQLTDAPSAYAGQAGNLVQVKNDETGLQFATFITGVVTCNTSSKIYNVSDARILSTHNPIVTVIGPSATSEILMYSVEGIINGSFNIVLSGVPEVGGYKIKWAIL